jgi:hypothetical protein
MKTLNKNSLKNLNFINHSKRIPHLSNKQILYLKQQYFLLINLQNITNQKYKFINLKK